MAQNIKLVFTLNLTLIALLACDTKDSDTLNSSDSIENVAPSTNASIQNPSSANTSSNSEPEITKLDGSWLSDCTNRYPQSQAQFEQEVLIVEGSSYERTINFYQDANCAVPSTISFLSVSTTALQYPGGSVQTELGAASQIVVSAPIIDFDRSQLTIDDAELYDPALYFYDFYLFASDGRLRFGSTNTSPSDQFEQTLDSPHIFTAQ